MVLVLGLLILVFGIKGSLEPEAEKLGFIHQGIADVQVEVLDAGHGKTSDPARTFDHALVEEKEFYDFEIEQGSLCVSHRLIILL